MMAPNWIMNIFAAIMLAVAATSAVRLATARPWRKAPDADIDAAHLLMGISMAGMLAVGLQTLPNSAWEVVFGILTAWFAWRVMREARTQRARVLTDGHHVPHLVHSAAMLYMFAGIAAPMTGAGGSGMGGMHMGGASGPAMQTLRLPGLALLFALWLSAYVVLDLDRLSGPGHAHGSYFAKIAPAPAGAGLAAPSAADGSLAVGAAFASSMTAPGDSVTTRSAEPVVRDQAATATSASRALLLSPQVAAGCRIAMGVTMAFMLVIMI